MTQNVCWCVQGLGLYAARDLEKHTMVIEYIGDLIRNEVANRREQEYESQVGMGSFSRSMRE
jgi:SET domain-containing protein